MGFRSHFMQRYNNKIIKKELEALQAELYRKFNLNKGSNCITIERDEDGDFILVLYVPVKMVNKMASEKPKVNDWVYGTFYMDNEMKTGFRRLANNNWLFFETENRIDNTKINLYKNASDLAEAIKLVNPTLKDRIVCIENKIEIIGAINDIYFPSTDLVYDSDLERVYSTINPDYVFEIKFVNAHQRDLRAKNSKDSYRAGDGTKYTAIRESLSERREQQEIDSDGLENIDISTLNESVFNYNRMRKVHEKYKSKFNSKIHSYVVEGGKQSYNYDIEIVKGMTHQEKQLLKINQIWINAYTRAMGGAKSNIVDNKININDAFPGYGYSIQQVFDALTKCDGKSLTSIIDMMIKGEDMSYEFMRTVVNFVSNPDIASIFDIELDMKPQAGYKYMDVVMGRENPENLANYEPSVMEKYYRRHRKK